MLYKEFWNEIIKNNKIVICTHVNHDGDTVGTAFGLKHLILESFPNKKVKISGEKINPRLNMIDENEEVSDVFFKEALVIVVDTSTEKRVADKRVISKEAINLDHHKNDSEWKIRVGSDDYPAAGEVLYEMLKELDLPVNSKVLIGIFIAIWTDTFGMTQRNISKRTHDALELIGWDIQNEFSHVLDLSPEEEKILNILKNELVIEKDFAYLISEKEISNMIFRNIIDELFNYSKAKLFFASVKQENNQRCSFRSDGSFDVSHVAEKFGGGGHATSSGTLKKTVAEAQEILNYVKNIYNP